MSGNLGITSHIMLLHYNIILQKTMHILSSFQAQNHQLMPYILRLLKTINHNATNHFETPKSWIRP